MSTTVSPTDSSTTDLQQYCHQTAENAKRASAELASLDAAIKNRWLHESADALIAAHDAIMAANAEDIAAAPGYGLTDAAVDRLKLDAERIVGIAGGFDGKDPASP